MVVKSKSLGRGVSPAFDVSNKKCYKQEWKLFSELDGDEMVMTLNQESGESEWHKSLDIQDFAHDGEMYRIETSEGDLVVSPEHMVYVGEDKEKMDLNGMELNQLIPSYDINNEEDYLSAYFIPSNFIKSSVENISISDCSLKAGSSDQIGVLLNANDKAKYGSSFISCLCGDILLASDRNFEYLSSSNVSKSLSNSEKSLVNSNCEIFAKCIMSDLLLSNSSNTYSGDIRVEPMSSNFLNTCLLADDLLKNENKIVASTISSLGISDNIFYNPCLLATRSFNSSASLNANSSVILLFFNISSNSLNLFALSNLLTNSCLISSDQITQENLDSLGFNSSSIANVMDAIYILPSDFNFSNFLSSSTFSIMALRATSATFTSGNSFLNFFNNSSGTDTVILGILVPSSNYFDESKDVFKSFGEEDLSDFSLQPITEVYSRFEGGEEIWFMDGEGEVVVVESITKELYDGRIYDVDVPNDVILVERDGLVVWSGNSNHGTRAGDAVLTDAGKFGKGFEFDGVGDYVDLGNSLIIKPNLPITISTWVKPASNGYSTIVTNDDFNTQGSGNYYGVLLQFTNAQKIQLQFGNGGAASSVGRNTKTGTTTLQYDNWYYVVGVINGYNDMSIYLNGVDDNGAYTGTATTLSYSSASGFIGRDDATNDFNGSIDDVLIFNRSLSATEILALYNASATSYENNFTGLAEGSHVFTGHAVDLGGNWNSTEERTVTTDTVAPLIDFVAPTLANDSTTGNISVEVNVSITEVNLDEFTWNWNGTNYTLFNDSLVLMMNFDNVSDLGECYDEETEILTDSGWKLFEDLDRSEMVMTLNQESGKGEWQMPMDWQEFDYDNDMYKVELEDGSDLLVSEKHRVYSDEYKKKKDSNGMVKLYNLLILSNVGNDNNYINVSVGDNINHVGMAEWLTQFIDTKRPSGYVGSIPTPGVILDFSLQLITEVYNDYKNGEEIYFLDENNNPVKVESIGKELYDGKIYDVDVENDVVLVRRRDDEGDGVVGGSAGLWSGNSDSLVKDVSGYGNDGAVTNAVVNTTDCKFGNCFSFDGAGDYVDLGSSEDIRNNLNESMSISSWIYYQGSTTNLEAIVSSSSSDGRGGYYFVIYQNDIRMQLSKNEAGGAFAIAQTTDQIANQWIHIVGTYNGSDIKLYKNGVEESLDTDVKGSGNFDSQDTVTIGARDSGLANYFNGNIDEVRIYNRSLSADEIYELYVSNLQKYNSTDWYFYVNQSLNAIDGLVSGVYNYSAYVKDDAGWSAITELRTVTVQLDTCTAPGAGQWELDCADNCNFTTTTTVPGNVNMSGSGNVYIGANWDFTGSNQYVYVWPGCEVDIYSGGGFNIA